MTGGLSSETSVRSRVIGTWPLCHGSILKTYQMLTIESFPSDQIAEYHARLEVQK